MHVRVLISGLSDKIEDSNFVLIKQILETEDMKWKCGKNMWWWIFPCACNVRFVFPSTTGLRFLHPTSSNLDFYFHWLLAGPNFSSAMAQFTAHSRVKLLLNGDGVPFGSEPKDRFRYKLRSVRTLKRRIPLSGPSPSTSSTSALRKSARHAAEVRVGVRGESVSGDDAIVDLDYDYEFETDDLACFRGLVLDISYRLFNFSLIDEFLLSDVLTLLSVRVLL